MIRSPRALAPRLIAATLLLIALLLSPGCGMFGSTPPSADSNFDSAVDRPPSPMTLYTMSRILMDQGRDNEAQFMLVRVIHDDPKFVPAYCTLAQSQLRTHKPEDAFKTLTEGLTKAPNDPILLNNCGMCKLDLADYASALDYFTRASTADPRNRRYSANRAMALGMLGRYEESFAVYSQTLSSADAHYNLAIICESCGDIGRASEEYAKAQILTASTRPAAPANPLPPAPLPPYPTCP